MKIKIILSTLCLAAVAVVITRYSTTDPDIPTKSPTNTTAAEKMPDDMADNLSGDIDTIAQNTVSSSSLVAPSITSAKYQSTLGPLPKSLRGTSIPAAFELDSSGHLIITTSIKAVIEYFLSALGEEPVEQLVARIEEFFSAQLEEPARSEALDVLVQYIGYKEALDIFERELASDIELGGQANDYLRMFQYRREVRMNNLSPEIYDAFFADEDKADSYTAGILNMQKNPALTDEEKENQSQQLEQLLPPEEQAIKHAERERRNLNKNIKVARLAGATHEDIFELRAQVYDYETVERFAAADQKKADWERRFALYRQQRHSILTNDGLSNSDKQADIYTLQAQTFSQTERRRLPTLDELADKANLSTSG